MCDINHSISWLGLLVLSKFETILVINIRMLVCDSTGEESMGLNNMVLYKTMKINN